MNYKYTTSIPTTRSWIQTVPLTITTTGQVWKVYEGNSSYVYPAVTTTSLPSVWNVYSTPMHDLKFSWLGIALTPRAWRERTKFDDQRRMQRWKIRTQQ